MGLALGAFQRSSFHSGRCSGEGRPLDSSPSQCPACSVSASSRSVVEKMVGTWEYRSRWHRLIVGEYVVEAHRGALRVSESQSRGGLNLEGTLQPSADGWHEADMQHGFRCRLRLSSDGSTMESQFREADTVWEAPVVSRRQAPTSPQRASLILAGSLSASTMAAVGIFGPELGVGVMGLLLVHELGHVWAMRQFGLPSGPIVFIPLIGAAVEMRKRPTHAYHEGMILLAGPLFGTCAAFACLDIGATAIGSVGLMLETINLIPIGALDGGRLLPMLSSWALPASLAVCSIGLLLQPTFIPGYLCLPGLVAAIALGGPASSNAVRPERTAQYYGAMSTKQRRTLSAGYVSLLVLLTASQVMQPRQPCSHDNLAVSE